MSHEDVLSTHFLEKKTAKFTALLKDEDGTLVQGSELVTMILYLFNDTDKTIINSRNGGSILNANGGTIDESGNWTLTLNADDMALSDQSKIVEHHVIEVLWTYNGGAKSGAHRIRFPVYNLEKQT